MTLNTAGATGAFADASVGTGKTVFITGLTLNGTTCRELLAHAANHDSEHHGRRSYRCGYRGQRQGL